MDKQVRCPWCNGVIRIEVTDEEGNWQGDDYESDPWSGLGFQLAHDKNDVPKGKECPIATHRGQWLGRYIYDTRDEAHAAAAQRWQEPMGAGDGEKEG